MPKNSIKKKKIRVALGQVETSESKKKNLSKGLEFVRAASDEQADLLVLPELFMAYIPPDSPMKDFVSTAERTDGAFVRALASEVSKRRVHVVFGMLEKSEVRGRVHNTVVMLGPDGNQIAQHRKVQLFDSFGFRESDRILAGDRFEAPFETRLGRIGLITCYELRFPELSRTLALQGAQLILAPAAWVSGRSKEEHLSILARARALENTVFVGVACQTGRIFTGRSTLIDPFGIPLCDAGEEEGLVVTEIDLERITRVRRTLGSLQQLRKDVY